MAKEAKKDGAKKSIVDMINSLDTTVSADLTEVNSMEAEVREMAETQMKDEEKKEKANELVRITKRAVYTNIRLKIDAQYSKKTGEVMADARNKSLELLNQLRSDVVRPAVDVKLWLLLPAASES